MKMTFKNLTGERIPEYLLKRIDHMKNFRQIRTITILANHIGGDGVLVGEFRGRTGQTLSVLAHR